MNEQGKNQKNMSAMDAINTNGGDRSIPGLIKELANDITSLFTKEVALAKAEIGHSIREAKAGAVSMISGGSVLYAGFLFLLLSAVLGLATVIDLWLAALIVGAVVALVGFIMIQFGKKKLEPSSLKPQHTMNSLNKDSNAVRGVIR